MCVSVPPTVSAIEHQVDWWEYCMAAFQAAGICSKKVGEDSSDVYLEKFTAAAKGKVHAFLMDETGLCADAEDLPSLE